MRLSDFLELQLEPILVEWESFAKTLVPAASSMDSDALRDHAAQILRAVAADLRSTQSAAEQRTKSRGQAVRVSQTAETAAETHGFLRATSGFSMRQLVAEYRALRAVVLNLWATKQTSGPDAVQDMVRFNEAIDQAIAESVEFFGAETERWRQLFIGVLGHDLRNPLNSMLLTNQLIMKEATGDRVTDAAKQVAQAGERMKHLLDDLLDYNRVALHLGLRISPAGIELAQACREEIELQQIVWPDNPMRLIVEGYTVGFWDGFRIKQLVGNLIANAAKYGERRSDIAVKLTGSGKDVILAVENFGAPIPAHLHGHLFEPLQRDGQAAPELERTSLGLGLFIVREIARAHGGEVTAASSKGKTTFSVLLPRTAARLP